MTDEVKWCDGCGKKFEDMAEAGGHIKNDCDGELVDEKPEAAESEENETMSENDTADDTTTEETDVTATRIGPVTYTVSIGAGDSDEVEAGIYRANLETGGVETLVSTEDTGALAENQKQFVLDQLVRMHRPSVDELAYQQAFELAQNQQPAMYAHEAMGGGDGGSSGGSSGGDDGGSNADVDVVTDAPTGHDYDEDELVDNVSEWLSNYANVKGPMIDGAYDLSFVKINDPEGGSELGVFIDDAPWHGPHWDHDAGHFEGGSQPDEWADHNEAMRSIYNDDDSPVEAVREETDGEYDDWYNYVPADDASDL